MHTERKIIHIDMDAFFAAVEQRDHPELRGKAIAVGFDGARGVVSTASYEARRFGVHSAMSVAQAKRLCPDLIVVSSDYEHYKEVSFQIHEIFSHYTDIIEPLSLDEAFLDVTANKKNMSSAKDIAQEIRAAIRSKLNLTASAGVSYNKFLAKIASDYNKPDGMFVITPEEAPDFIASLPIERFWGVGPKTAEKMHKMGIFAGIHLRRCSLKHLVEVFGKTGSMFYDFARGIDLRRVETDRVRKSVGCEQTFLEDISTNSSIILQLYHIVIELIARIKKSGFRGNTLTLKIKFNDFTQITRSYTSAKILTKKEDILPLAKQLLYQSNYRSKPIRLLGVSVSNPYEDFKARQWVEGTLPFKDWERI